MPALSTDRLTNQRSGSGSGTAFEFLVASAQRVYAGSMVAVDTSAGAVRSAIVSATLRVLGIANAQVLGDGATQKVQVLRGIFKLANATAADACLAGDVGADCFVVDDQTVARINTGGRQLAGRICAVDTDGVWVEF